MHGNIRKTPRTKLKDKSEHFRTDSSTTKEVVEEHFRVKKTKAKNKVKHYLVKFFVQDSQNKDKLSKNSGDSIEKPKKKASPKIKATISKKTPTKTSPTKKATPTETPTRGQKRKEPSTI